MEQQVPPLVHGGRSPREAILHCVQADAGITKTQLMQAVGVAWGTICYHIDVLEAAGLVRTVNEGRATRVYLPRQDARHATFMRVLRDPEARAIADYLAGQRQGTLPEIMRELNLSRKVARTRVAYLIQAGVIENIGTGWGRFRSLSLDFPVAQAQ